MDNKEITIFAIVSVILLFILLVITNSGLSTKVGVKTPEQSQIIKRFEVISEENLSHCHFIVIKDKKTNKEFLLIKNYSSRPIAICPIDTIF